MEDIRIENVAKKLSALRRQGISSLEQAQGMLAEMERMGLVRRTGEDRNGQPLYALTSEKAQKGA